MFESLLERLRSLLPHRRYSVRRWDQRTSLLRLLRASQRESIDPAVLVANLAAEYPDRYGRRLQQLARWLAAGSSLGAAAASTPGVLDEDDTFAIQCAVETGTVEETLEALLRRERDMDGSTAVPANSAVYLLGALAMAFLVSLFVIVFVIPTLHDLFREFDTELPSAMVALQRSSQNLTRMLPWLLILIALAATLLYEDVRRILMRALPRHLWPATRRRRRAGLLRLLAVPTGLGQPLTATLTAAAQHHPDPRLRRRLLTAREQCRSDDEVWSQLVQQRLIGAEEQAQFCRLPAGRFRSWAMIQVAEQLERGCEHARRSRFPVLLALPILALGGYVGWIAYAVLATLTELVHSLAS